jgi:hypothetical protein
MGRTLVWESTNDNPARDRDVHVLRGFSSRDLIDDLRFRVEEEDDDLEIEAGQIVFKPLFKGEPDGDLFKNDDIGIKVDTKTGEVIADPPGPEDFKIVKNNFLIEIDGVGPDHETENTAVIRVHVHLAVADVWLTPRTLTVRPTDPASPGEVTRARFAVHALFDTGIVGDLTLGHGVIWKTAPPAAPNRNVKPSGLLVIDASDVPPKDIQITAKLPASFGGATTPPATLRIRPAFANEPARPKATIVAGSAHAGELWEGAVVPERVPNVLFVSDGFRAQDEANFDRAVDTIVHHLKTDFFTRPFDLVSTRMNFWKTFVPAADLGISVRSEVFSYDGDAGILAEPMPTVEKPPAAGETWKLENLLYAVGLPVPGDLFDENADPKTPHVLREEWKKIVEDDLSDVPDKIIEDLTDPDRTTWKKLAMGREFIEQLDAFPGLSLGAPPAASAEDNSKLRLYDEHGGERLLKSFYSVMEAAPAANGNVAFTGTGKPIGDLWVNDDEAYDFMNTTLQVIVSSFEGGRPLNAGRISMGLRDGNIPIQVKMTPGRAEFQLDLTGPPADIETNLCRTTAHELGHSFGLGDEYRDRKETFTGGEEELADDANLQSEADAQVEIDEGGTTKKVLDGDEIRWRWHRIRKAAVISGEIFQAGDAFRLPLETGQGLQFQKGEGVLLRFRKTGIPLRKGQRTLGDKTLGKELVITDTPEISALVSPDDVEEYKKGNIQYVAPAAGSSVTFDDIKIFERGSLLYAPTPSADSVPAGHPYAETIAWNIKELITETRKPLTKSPCPMETDDEALEKRKEVAQWPNLGHANVRSVWAYKIVGLYSGGRHYACGIFHPTGSCMMRDSDDAHSAFCAVCRYVLVDMIHPFRHFENDRDYEEDYPQPPFLFTPP